MQNDFRSFVFIFISVFTFTNISAQNYIDSIINKVNIDSLVYRVEEISGERSVVVNGLTDTIKSRHKSKPGNELTYQYILQKFSSYGLQTDSLVFSTTGKNAIAKKTGLVYPDKYFIICAHYDDMPNSLIAPAADDNGSGVGAVIEAARILSQYEFEYSILFACWDEEEQGKLGSAAFASLANTQNDSLMGVINMDAIGYDSNNDNTAMIHTNTIANSLSIASLINNVNATYNIGLDLNMISPGATYSDHASFWNNGFGAVLIIEDWANDANPNYHTVNDKVMYFNLPYFEKLSKLSIASIATLAVPIGYSGEEELLNNVFVQLYPNPVTETIIISAINNKTFSVGITDLNGRTMMTFPLQNNTIVDVTFLPKGIYFIRISNGEYSCVKRIIKL